MLLILLSPFYPEKYLRNKGNFTCGGFHLKDKKRENWKNSRRETSLDEKKGETKMDEDEKG